MPTIEQSAADNLIASAMLEEKESTVLMLLNAAKRLDPTVEVNKYYRIWLNRWLVETNRERSN